MPLAAQRETQFSPLRPQFLGLEDAQGRNDAGDQLRRSDVEAGIKCAAGRVGHTNVGER